MRKLATLFLITTLVFGSMNLIPNKVEAAEEVEVVAEYIPPASLITDISNHWAEEPISALVNYGILSGYSDKTFKPDNQITRSEYMAALFKTVCIIDESINLEEYHAYMGNLYFHEYRAAERLEFLEAFKKSNYDAPCKDLENYWAKNIVAWIKNYADKKNPGLFEKVFPGERFYPDQPITREEAAAITVTFLAPPVRSRNIQFNDIAPDYKFIDEITYLVDNDVINGLPDGTFRPKENITRAAAAVIMTNVLKDIAYNTNFFASPDNYMTYISSTSDGDYIPTFMSEELYENPPTEEDKKYVAYFKGYIVDLGMAQELMGSIYHELDSMGLEHGTEEYEKAYEQLENEIIAKYDKIKLDEIPYYHGIEDRLNVLKELEQGDYWNKAGLYYWLYRYDENSPVEYLEKAQEAYDISKNGKDDLYALYKAFVDYYSSKEKNSEKVVEYIHKMEDLFVPNEYGEKRVASVEIERFHLFAAFDLAQVGEYSEALNYVDKYLAIEEYPYENIILEKGSLMHMAGQTDAAIKYLKENLTVLEQQEYVDAHLKTRFIWAIKTMMRQK